MSSTQREMATQIYRIVCTRGQWDHEVYYEPTPLTKTERANLKSHGWTVRVTRIDAEQEIARLTGAADRASGQSAELAGASSATHTYGLAAGLANEHAQAVRQAAEGHGSLRA